MEDYALESAPAVLQEPQQTSSPGHKRVNSDETERPSSAQRGRDDSEEHLETEAENDVLDEEEADPALRIADFDWGDLHERYHDAIKKSSREEEALMQEWASLMEYFQIWANSGHEHETDRTFRRHALSANAMLRVSADRTQAPDEDDVRSKRRKRFGGKKKPLQVLQLSPLVHVLMKSDVNVVRAFESALNLLKQNTMFRS
ncbi:hypothetical protein SVAN01_05318 [Stagonosporopsis vannaccii]|nr:hypothetical protein SVAN01_05318 [Stagonosporopsis vannaccii]